MQRVPAHLVSLPLYARFALICLLFAPLHSHTAYAQVIRRNNESVLAEEVDYYHEAISKGVLRMANRIDQFFVDDRILDESNKTQLQFSTAVRYEDGRNLTIRMSLKGRIVLPYLQERWQVFVDTDGPERDIKDDLRQTEAVTEDDKSLFTGLRYVTHETRRSRVSVDGGLRWRGGPVPFVRLRARRTLTYDPWALRFTQLFFWFENRGFGERTTIDFDRWLDDTHLFRATPSVIWSEESQGVDLRQSFSVYCFWSDDTMIAVHFDVEGHTRPTAQVDKYEATLRWRQRSYRDWMFYEVAPAMAFPRENDFALTPILTLKVEILFGDSTLPAAR